MSLRTLLIVFTLLLAAVGCSDDAVAPASAPDVRSPVIEIAPLGPSSLRLRWRPLMESGALYLLQWGSLNNGRDSGSIATGDTTAVVATLVPGTPYRFTLTPYRNGAAVVSDAVATTWGAADRYTVDRSGRGSIRLYESGSDSGSALVLDPDLGGPVRVQVPSGLSFQVRAQLALWTAAASATSFKIGPAYAFGDYRSTAGTGIDSSVMISSTTQLATSLATWFTAKPVDRLIDPDGARKVYSLPGVQPDNQGQGFYVRTGEPGRYHYARVLIMNVGGKLLQGSYPDRFVELEISYQTTPNLPYAKRERPEEAPEGVRAGMP